MNLFYSDRQLNNGFLLDEQESRHLIKVLRTKNGQEVNVTNGDGNLYRCILVSENAREAWVEIAGITENYDRRNYRLTLAVAPTKNIDRFETFVEKCVEIGVDKIVPIVTSRSERRSLRIERIEKIALSAMKQSLKTKSTIIDPVTPFSRFIAEPPSGRLYIAWCAEDMPDILLGADYHKGEEATVMIGPEGDFTNEESESAIKAGFTGINLGKSRLRTETAGIVACSRFYFLNH
ncbi:MAG: 16S rRNA (uracil(1498)-N(3))-methyltransferase [Bacteroidales bacterium]